MKVKLDENIPSRVGAIVAEAGHDVDTVVDEGLAGADDPAVSAAATAAERLVLTLDRGFGDIRRLPARVARRGSRPACGRQQAAPAVARVVGQLLESVALDDLAGCVAVFRDGDLRVRRPA